MTEASDPSSTVLDDLWPPSGAAGPGRSGPPRPQKRRRDTSLTRHDIVQTAIALADAEGAAAVNMRRIANELGAGAMSLYWHVTDKEQLLDLMLDVVEGESTVADLSGDWKADLRQVGRQKRQALLAHPWVVAFMSGRDQLGPNALLQIERSLSVLDGLDVDAPTALHMLMAIDSYVTGSVLNELREVRVEMAQARAGLSDAEVSEGMRAWRERLDSSGMFVRVLRIFEEGIDPDAAETRDERFAFGLDCLLDGLATRVAPMHPGTR